MKRGKPELRKKVMPVCEEIFFLGAAKLQYLYAHNSSTEGGPPADERLCTAPVLLRYGQVYLDFLLHILLLAAG